MRNLACAIVVCASVLVAACGQKGPLVLPDAQKHKPTTANPANPLTAPAPAPAAAPTAVPTPTPTQSPAQMPTQTPAPAGAGAQSRDGKPSDATTTP
jgi:predicted small lipoprotein YifL